MLRDPAISKTQAMRTRAPYKVLFLCTGNSARSIIAEYLLRARGSCRFESYSAGAIPAGKVNPYTIEVWSVRNVGDQYLLPDEKNPPTR